MMLTEAEAKTKWCPFSRVIAGKLVDQRMYVQVPTQPHNRVQEDGGEVEATTHAAMNCLGSGCMAWVWTEPMPKVRGSEMIDMSDHKNPRRWHEMVDAPQNRKGCCGLAGRP